MDMTYCTGRRTSVFRRPWLWCVLVIGGLLLLDLQARSRDCHGEQGHVVRTHSSGVVLRPRNVWQVKEGADGSEEDVFLEDKEEVRVKPEKRPMADTKPKTLSEDIHVIVSAVLKAGRVEMKPFTSPLVCKKDRLNNEVEDILCIPKPQFLEDVRNPCWWDTAFPGSKKSILRCLPKFHILGCEKCGSSDLWQRITSHPHTVRIQGTKNKEANWWAWQRYGLYANRSAVEVRNFTRYTNSFRPIAKKIEASLKTHGDEHRFLITEDGTPSDLFDFRGWRNISQNRGLQTPSILTPHLMKHVYPHPRFIAIFRNPIDRLYSDYYFASHGINATGFHEAVVKAIPIAANCLRDYTPQQCFFSKKLYASLPVRFHYMFYSIYLREWLQVFPRETFLFFKMEEYELDPISALRTSFRFLGLQPLNDTRLESIAALERFRVGVKKQEAGEMLPATRTLLDSLARPCNKQFARLMGHSKFNWD